MLAIHELGGDPKVMKLYQLRSNMKDCLWGGDYQSRENVALLLWKALQAIAYTG